MKYILLILSLFLLPACKTKRATQKAEAAKWRRVITIPRKNRKMFSSNVAAELEKSKKVAEHPPVTIWVHGTTNNPVFRLFHSGPLGFHRMADLDSLYRMRTVASMLERQNGDDFSYGHCYIFSWSGDLSFEAREKAAKDLYGHIKHLVAAYKELFKQTPYIRIITHSHGGNVALNLAKVRNFSDTFCIDELTLLGCPVQHVTQEYCTDPFFKAVNNVVSEADLIQLGDPQALYAKTKEVEKDPSFFSNRWFTPHKHVVQCKIKINGRAPFHSEMIFDPFIKTIPAIIAECKTIRAEQMNGAAPADAQYLFKIVR